MEPSISEARRLFQSLTESQQQEILDLILSLLQGETEPEAR